MKTYAHLELHESHRNMNAVGIGSGKGRKKYFKNVFMSQKILLLC